MTIKQLILVIAFYSALLVAVTYITRANTRRLVGSIIAGTIFGLVGLFGFVLGEDRGWWQMPKSGIPHFYTWLWLGLAISCTPSYLVLWRIVRRFGARGLAISVLITTIIGPPRDYWIVSMFPAWMTFAPGVTPVLADAAIYTLLVVVGYAVMRVVSGSAQSDVLARSQTAWIGSRN